MLYNTSGSMRHYLYVSENTSNAYWQARRILKEGSAKRDVTACHAAAAAAATAAATTTRPEINKLYVFSRRQSHPLACELSRFYLMPLHSSHHWSVPRYVQAPRPSSTQIYYNTDLPTYHRSRSQPYTMATRPTVFLLFALLLQGCRGEEDMDVVEMRRFGLPLVLGLTLLLLLGLFCFCMRGRTTTTTKTVQRDQEQGRGQKEEE
ncbi:uncharacterized protein LOC143019774 [Oratosquilla oratoria]|uniref:uncharacterized protein LOC143019774 n=1 Tax=Oratosquilla oratoria TaxID=337810 RepID=UPI003F7729CC